MGWRSGPRSNAACCRWPIWLSTASAEARVVTSSRPGSSSCRARNVYGVVGSPASIERDLRLGLLCLGPGALVSHEAAARLHRFDRARPDAVEFTVIRSRRSAACPFTVHSTEVLGRLDRVTVDGFACTSATRTIIDVARLRIPAIRLEAAIDSAVRTGASSPVTLAARLG